MKRINNITVLVAAIFSMTSLFAQITTNELPPSFSKSVLTQTDYVSLIPPNMNKILAEDSINDTIPGILRRVAVAIPVLLTAEKDGTWSTFSDGDLFWTLSIKVENAQSLDLVFDKFWLPESGRLFIYNKQTRQTIGAVTSEYLQGNKDNPADFSTEIILGDELTLEYYQSSTIKEKPVINISKVFYGYRDVDKYNENIRGFEDSGDCQVNINCLEGQSWQNEKDAVARIYVKLPTSSGWCSGALVNNTANNYTPLFLTANHCFSGYFDAINNSNLSQWIFYWNYEFPGCVNLGIQPVLRSTTGATVTANNSVSDFALLQLTQDPRNLLGFEPYYLGWDRSGNAGTGGVGIHHPVGDVKKIATYNTSPSNSTCMNDNFWQLGFIATSNGHSIMEPGSSGSPLINSQRKMIGQLYGPGNLLLCPEHLCGNNPSQQRVSYGKFSVSWTGNGAADNRRRLDHWLDPIGSSPITIDGCKIPTISGPSLICTTGTYTINNLPSGATVNWLTNKNLNIVSGQGTSTVVVSKQISGLYGRVSAEITINGNTFTISKSGIQVGTETLLIKMYNSAGTAEIAPPYYVGSSYKIVAYGSGTAFEPDENFYWTVTPPASCDDCFISLYDGAIIPFTAYSVGSYTFTLKYYNPNECGWGDEVSKSFYFDLDQSLFSIYPNPATNLLTIELASEDVATYQANDGTLLSRSATMSVAPYTVQLWHERNGLVRTVESTESVVQMSLQGLPKGMYFVHLVREGQITQKQMLWVR